MHCKHFATESTVDLNFNIFLNYKLSASLVLLSSPVSHVFRSLSSFSFDVTKVPGVMDTG